MPDESAITPVTAPAGNGAGTAEEASGDVYTMIEAARLKGVSYHTVSRAVRRGKLPARRLGRMALIAADDLRAWRPMRERAPHKYRRREPNPEATPALLDLASGERVELARNLSTLYEAVYGAAADQPLPEFLALVCERLATVLDFRRVAIWQVDETTQRATPVARFGPPMTSTPEEQPLSELPLLRQVMERREAVVVPNVEAAGYDADWQHVTSLFAAPLHVGNRQLGAIFADRGGDPFTLSPAELSLAQGLAHQTAVAIEHDRLRTAESARADQLAAILENISEAVMACDASGRMTICNAAGRELLGLEGGPLDVQAGTPAAGSHVERRTERGEPIPPDATPIMRALTGETVQDMQYVISRPGETQGRLISVSARPIRRGDEIVGAVSVAREVAPVQRAAQA